MNAINIKRTQVDLGLDLDDVLSINNALNEICNGLGLPDFEIRLGCEQENALNLLEKFSCLYDEIINSSNGSGLYINLNAQEIILITKSFRTVFDEIELFEFEARLGVERNYMSGLLEKFIYVQNEMRGSMKN